MIILHGNDKDILSVKLHDILMEIDRIDIRIWKLLWIEAVSSQMITLRLNNTEMYMSELEEVVNNSKDGILISPDELLKMSTLFDDLIEIVIIGDKDEFTVQKKGNDDEIKSRCEYFIELVDSSYWEITTKDNKFVSNLKRNFTFQEIT